MSWPALLRPPLRIPYVSRTHTQRFLVLPETTVHTHKAALAHHLTPQIENLISKAESSLEAQRAKIKRLEEKLSILEDARGASSGGVDDKQAPAQPPVDDFDEDQSMDSQLEDVDLRGLDAAQRKRLIMLKGKRRRLEAERQALGL